MTSDSSLDSETRDFLSRHNVFLRGARDAAHQALFFLGMLYEPVPGWPRWVSRAVHEYREYALHQVMGLVHGLLVPTASRKLAEGEELDILKSAEAGEIRRAGSVAHSWIRLQARFDGEQAKALQLSDMPELRDQLQVFLRDSKPSNSVEWVFQQSLPNIFGWLGKHVALTLAALLVVGVSLGVEVVSGLLFNEGLRILWYLTVIPLPLLFFVGLIRYLRRKYPLGVLAWEIGSPPFWGYLSVAPNHLIDRWPERAKIVWAIFLGQVTRLAVYLGWSILAFWVLRHTFGGTSTATFFLTLLIFYAILLAAHTLDFFDFIFSWPVRFLVLIAAAIALLALRVGWGREVFIFLSVGLALFSLIVSWLYRRGRLGFRVVAIAALVLAGLLWEGLLTHSKEIWTVDGNQLTRLTADQWPFPSAGDPPLVVVAASGGGSRAAIYAGLTLQQLNSDPDLRGIAAQIQAISSVSGGSLANAAYVARLLRMSDSPSIDWERRNEALEDLVDALSDDFLYPTIKGALVPGLTRGGAIEAAWQEPPVSLGSTHLQDLTVRWLQAERPAEAPPFPIPLFNTTSLDGYDVVISPLEKSIYTDSAQQKASEDVEKNLYQLWSEEGEPTWVFYRDGIYGLEDLLPSRDVPLAQAVRASANFPFGFPVVRILTQERLYLSPAGWGGAPGADRLVRLTDGGALSNSGLWSLYHLLMRMSERENLRERGVLLIVVEASKMPSYRGFAGTFKALRGTIEDQGGIGRNLHQRMYDQLEKAYRGNLAVAQIDLSPLEADNVMTTWALDRRTLGQLKSIFERRWAEERDGILGRWKYLKDGVPFAGELIDRRRPPLD